ALSGKPKPMSLLEKYISDTEFIDHIKVYEESFPHYELLAEDYICEDDKVVVRARVKGVHKGDLMGIPPTGKTIDLPFTVIYKVKDEKIVKGWLYIDRMELMHQLGISSMN
ncbi:MAG: ester cyclase, partial [Bacteroidia bacterium]|nr:ester cyclase [Bacteroidia bacterium]